MGVAHDSRLHGNNERQSNAEVPQSSSRTEDRPTLVSTHVQVESEPPPTSICPLEQVRSRPTKFGLTSRPLQLTPQAPRSHPSRPLCPYRVTVLDRGSRSEPAMGGPVAPDMLGSRGREHLWLNREVFSGRCTQPPRRSAYSRDALSLRKPCSTRVWWARQDFKPVTSSVSAKYREPLCGRPFSQVARDRRCRS